MSCVHLKKLYELCAQEDLKIGATDLVRIVCNQCGEQEACPSLLMDAYEATEGQETHDRNEDSSKRENAET